MLILFRGIIGLDSFGLDDDTCVAPLVVLTLVGNRPRHVTTRQHYTRHNDRHNQNLFHISPFFSSLCSRVVSPALSISLKNDKNLPIFSFRT